MQKSLKQGGSEGYLGSRDYEENLQQNNTEKYGCSRVSHTQTQL